MDARSEAFREQAGKGRPKGATNHTTRLAKQAIAEAFDKLGGMEALVEWAKRDEDNLKVFYATIWPKIIPLEVNGTHDVSVVDRTEQVRRAQEIVRDIFDVGSGSGAGNHGGGLPH
jgi:hypothetical protein